MLAIRVLGRGLGKAVDDRQVLKGLLTPQYAEEVQVAAVQRLGGIVDPRVPDQLIAPWKSLSPAVRNQVVDVLLARLEWTRMVMDALEQRRILPYEIDTIRRQKLLDHRDAEIRRNAVRVFAASSNPDRAKVVNDYWISIPERGDAQQGSKHFAKHCAACHQVAGIGQQVGPDLASVGDKSPQGLLTAILDPNRAVEARYVNYTATTKAGLSISGLLQGETSTTITLVAADGKKHDLLRQDLDELTSTGKSVMPDGFEKEIPHAAMADLLAFLRGNLAKPKNFPGNRPEVVRADANGSLKLLATSAAIFGKTLVFEEKHKNLGYWSSVDDQAVWTLEVPKPGRYEVSLDYACESGSGGNTLVVEATDARLTHKVQSTASWDLYRSVKIGSLRLAAGRHDLSVRGDGAIRGALLDLRGIELIPSTAER
jgi:putative heme-binding domain-containing protein